MVGVMLNILAYHSNLCCRCIYAIFFPYPYTCMTLSCHIMVHFFFGQVEQPWRTVRSPGDLTIRWIRRSRALAADSWEAVEVPLAEDSEAYQVEIRDGVTVKRTLSSGTTSALYTTAQQIADWGAPLGPGSNLDIRIYQLSALIGRGAARAVTLTF